ncbi:hypothetical protein SADUNF_Sadunf15G0070100 [Salix dunnii]|uniref:Homeobox protein knotted-1-like 6 n=1 Tax=Salix dunnii TaxID=1413687 RepID=A0A835JGF0_9ROSI|nr:hypothetical protein SADUNF_Sadunf15G0070100 [Salix dunnii]
MEQLYGLQSTSTDYSLLVPSENEVAPVVPNYYHHMGFPSAAGEASFPFFGSEQLLCGSSVSDAASMEEASCAIRDKIASHPLYPRLLEAYIDCQKEAYCAVLMKYKADLSRPFDEATAFLNDIEAQFNTLCSGASRSQAYGLSLSLTHFFTNEAVGSSDEEASGGEVDVQDCSRANEEDRELKDKLLCKYSGYISTLKHEFSKKKKKGKLPKEAKKILLDWWTIHNKWPYPTEADKVALAESTGLEPKQINNWFINQRKRHWKPSENMQVAFVDSLYGPFFTND